MKKHAEAHISIFRIPMKTTDAYVEYIKIDEEGNKMEVLLNTSEKEIKVKEAGEVLFAREFDGEILGVNGTLIRRI